MVIAEMWSKATGIDQLPAKLLKIAAHVIVNPIQKICNKALTTGKLPEDWKKAKVTALYKDGDSEEHSNYRPISICMKVFGPGI